MRYSRVAIAGFAPALLVLHAAAMLLVALGAASPAAFAQDLLRCGNSIIRVGMSDSEVTARCGAPDAKEVVEIPVRVRRPSGAVEQIGVTSVERWTYDRGAGQFPALLTFEEGRLQEIELLTGR